MKAVVLKVEGKNAAVLAADGTFRSVRNRNYTKGQKLELSDSRLSRTVISMVSAAAAVLLLAGGITANTYACSTVTLDVNPSLKYELNLFDRVLDFEAYNEDGQEIVDKLESELKGRRIDDAIGLTLDELEKEDYIEEATPVVVTLNSRFKADRRLEKRTEGGMKDWNEKHAESGSKRSINGETVIVTDDLSKKAGEKKQSPGRIYMDEHYPENDIPKEPQTETSNDAGARQDKEYQVQEPSDPERPTDHNPQPDAGANQPDENTARPDSGVKPPDENTSSPDNGMKAPDENTAPPDSGVKPSDENTAPPDNGMNPPNENRFQPNGETPQPNEGMQPPESEMQPPGGSTPPNNGGFQPPEEGGGSPGGDAPPNGGFQPSGERTDPPPGK